MTEQSREHRGGCYFWGKNANSFFESQYGMKGDPGDSAPRISTFRLSCLFSSQRFVTAPAERSDFLSSEDDVPRLGCNWRLLTVPLWYAEVNKAAEQQKQLYFDKVPFAQQR